MTSNTKNSILREHRERLEFLRKLRAEHAGIIHNLKAERGPLYTDGALRFFVYSALPDAHNDEEAHRLNTERGFTYTVKGLRYFVYPALPDALRPQTQIDLCKAWSEKELITRGMVVDISLYTDGPIFCCPTRQMGPKGFGLFVEEWNTPEFSSRLQSSFAQTVNDELEKRGLLENFTF